MADVKPLVRHPAGYPADLGSDTLVAEELKATVRGIDAGGSRVRNVGAPTAASDAVTKAYADSIAAGLAVKEPARVATTANVNLASPGATINGVALIVNDRVLVVAQTDKKQNGIYLWKGAAVAMVRSADVLAPGVALWAYEGATLADTQWVLTSPDSAIVVGTSEITFTQFKTLADLQAGRSISITGNTVALRTGSGLTTTGDVAVDRGDGLTASGKVAVQARASGGLSVNSAGVGVVQGPGISVGANVGVALAANSGLNTTSGLAVGPGNGIAVSGANVAVKLAATPGLTATSSGVAVQLAANSGLALGSTGLSVRAGEGLEIQNGIVRPKLGEGLERDETGTEIRLARDNGATFWLKSDDPVSAGDPVAANPSGNVSRAKAGTVGLGDVLGVAEDDRDINTGYVKVVASGSTPQLKDNTAGALPFGLVFLGANGGLVSAPPASGRIVRIGFMASDGLIVQVADYGER